MTIISHLIETAKRESGTSDRCEYYRKRLNAHLDTLPDDKARLEFLTKESCNWRNRYRVWCDVVDAGGDPKGHSAWDYTETIADLDKYLAKFRRRLRVQS